MRDQYRALKATQVAVYLTVVVGAASPRACALALRIVNPAPVEAVACRPVVVDCELRNDGQEPLRVTRPEAGTSLLVLLSPAPSQARTMTTSQFAVPEPAAVLDLPPGGTWRWPVWVDDQYDLGLPAGDYQLVVKYAPGSPYEAWRTTPALAQVVLHSQAVRLQVVTPVAADDAAACVLYQRVMKTSGELSAVFHEVGEVFRWAGRATASELLARHETPALRRVWGLLEVDLQRALSRQPITAAEADRAAEALAPLLRQPDLFPPEVVATIELSPLTRELLAAEGPRADPVFRNRCLLSDALPGCVEPSLLDLIHDYPRSPYVPLAMFNLARRYGARQPERCLYWLDELARVEPDFPLRDAVRWQRVEALEALGRTAEARPILPLIQDGWQRAQRQLKKLEAEPQR